jgi:hypothetical protein
MHAVMQGRQSLAVLWPLSRSMGSRDDRCAGALHKNETVAVKPQTHWLLTVYILENVQTRYSQNVILTPVSVTYVLV